jgi:arginine exporter protein ArgO
MNIFSSEYLKTDSNYSSTRRNCFVILLVGVVFLLGGTTLDLIFCQGNHLVHIITGTGSFFALSLGMSNWKSIIENNVNTTDTSTNTDIKEQLDPINVNNLLEQEKGQQ